MASRIVKINGLGEDDRDHEYAKRFGVSEREYRAYRAQKNNAARRGIEFRFTPNEWANWWSLNLPAGERRGRKRDQYVMARRQDRGAYEPGNVFVATPRENVADRHPEDKAVTSVRLFGHSAPHLKDRMRHPRAQTIVTPDGIWPSSAIAAEHYGITRQAAAYRARKGLFGWRQG